MAPIFRAVFRRDGLSRSCRRTTCIEVSQREPDCQVYQSRCVVHIRTAIPNCSLHVYLIDVKRNSFEVQKRFFVCERSRVWILSDRLFWDFRGFLGYSIQMLECSPLKFVLHPLPFDFITHGLLYRSTAYKHSACKCWYVNREWLTKWIN